MEDVIVLKISKDTEPGKAAGAIAEFIGENKKVELRAMGVGAVNQAVKAIAVARGYVAQKGINLYCIPAFTDIKIENEDRTAIKFIIKEEK